MDHAATLARIQSLIDVGRYAEARTRVTEYLAAEPSSVDGCCLLATCELELNAPAAAVRAAERAIRLAPSFDLAHRLRALGLSANHVPLDALDAAEEAVRLDPNDYVNHHTVALVLVRRSESLNPDEVVRAREAALRAVELAPHAPDAHIVAGLTAGLLKRRRDERTSYLEALRLDPQNAIAMNNLAAMDVRGFRFGRATRRIVAGLRMDPQEKVLHANLDGVLVSLVARLFVVVLVCGIGLVVILNRTGAWAPRAALAGGMLLVCGLVAARTVRHLPRGARLLLRGLPQRLDQDERVLAILLVVLAAAIVVVAAIPGDLGTVSGKSVLYGLAVLGLLSLVADILDLGDRE